MTTQPRALTVHQPVASKIAYGTQTTYNHNRATAYQGPVLIQAAAGTGWGGVPGAPDHRGAILATATLTGCHQADRCCGASGGLPVACWHWTLTEVRPLADPVPAAGRPGLWTPTPDLLAAITATPTAA